MKLALAAVLVAAAAATGAAAAPEQELPTRDCRARIESGRGPLSFTQHRAVVVGPIAFSGLLDAAPRRALGPWGDDGRLGRKSGVVVRAGRAVVLTVPERYRDRFFLHYTRGEEGTSSARIVPCAPGTRAFSYDGRVGPVTGFSGGFSMLRPGCYPLDVQVEGGRSYRVRIAFGYPCR
jgi:hypothetical protein